VSFVRRLISGVDRRNPLTGPSGSGRIVQASRLGMFLVFLLLFAVVTAEASIPNQIQRIAIHKKQNFTRIAIAFEAPPVFRVSQLSGGRIRVQLEGTGGRLFKGLRRYSDTNIGGLLLAPHGSDMVLTFATAAGRVGVRTVFLDGLPSLAFDVGPMFKSAAAQPQPLPGRERIRSGAEKLLKDFDPPMKPEIPFVPTDRRVLKNLLSDEEQKLFLAAEGALYKDKLTVAEEAFSQFAAKESQIRPLALYRLAEAQYRLQKYRQALDSFREAARLWQDFLTFNPSAMFYFGDSIARNGDLPGGRQLLARLIVNHADKVYAPILLVRLADVLERQGSDGSAMAIYTTVANAFAHNKAQQLASLKLADHAFLAATPDTYQPLSAEYGKIAMQASDFDLREEATFKQALLESINGPVDTALDLVLKYQKRFPKGVYGTVVHDMREDLVALTYQGQKWDKDPAGLIRLATDNQDYLARTVNSAGFLPEVTAAFEKAGRPLDLIALYSGLLERPWLNDDSNAYVTLQVADQAEVLGDALMTRRVLQGFLLKYPAHAQARWARERLAALQYAAKELSEVRNNLVWLLNKNEHALFPPSYYYLGRALWASKEYPRAALAMELYLAAVTGVKDQPPLVLDAYYVAASALQNQGNRKKAVMLLEQGVKLVKGHRDQLVYKLGELAMQDGRTSLARQYFEQLVKDGKDPDWQRLARLSLADLDVTSPPTSKKK